MLLLALLELPHLAPALAQLLLPVRPRLLQHAAHLGQVLLRHLARCTHLVHVRCQRCVVILTVLLQLLRIAHLLVESLVLTPRTLAEQIIQPVLGFGFREVLVDALHLVLQVGDVVVFLGHCCRRHAHRVGILVPLPVQGLLLTARLLAQLVQLGLLKLELLAQLLDVVLLRLATRSARLRLGRSDGLHKHHALMLDLLELQPQKLFFRQLVLEVTRSLHMSGPCMRARSTRSWRGLAWDEVGHALALSFRILSK
mmetsp:Transcript_8164/g.24615  ORF Transcript_8164/g.24615 Transcript_8164/m.24615 type:complete len:255 (+) Transcript_8164:3448-4212(+)